MPPMPTERQQKAQPALMAAGQGIDMCRLGRPSLHLYVYICAYERLSLHLYLHCIAPCS